MNYWTKEDIESILLQLNKLQYPFPNYPFSVADGKLQCIGKGSSAYIFEAKNRKHPEKSYAIKVIGFGDKYMDSNSFFSTIEIQKEICGIGNEDVVQLYGGVELWVKIQGDNQVVEVFRNKAPESEERILHLQCIVMEKLIPILSVRKMEYSLEPPALQRFDEKEIVKLAYEIGRALERAHARKHMHRDIKLENIFYDAATRKYKLGDFGIARMLQRGFASTAAFTTGYGAPEVVDLLGDKYDYRADIYSFGMVLYILLNELRFPDSQTYRPNISQYMQGYVPPLPVRGADKLCEIVLKMLAFRPEDRYQSMEEVLNALDGLYYRPLLEYQREHRKAPLYLGLLLGLGAAGLTVGEKKEWVSLGEYSFVTILLWSLSAVLLFYHSVLKDRDKNVSDMYFRKNGYWLVVAAIYGTIWMYISFPPLQELLTRLFGEGWLEQGRSWQLDLVAIGGIAFSLFWFCREWIVLWLNKKKNI